MDNKYIVFNGYKEIGKTNNLTDAEKMCSDYCEKQGVSSELKRKLQDDDIVVLIYQYRTLYLETFVITQKYEIDGGEYRYDV